MKKFLSVLLSVVLVVSLISIVSFAASAETVEDLTDGDSIPGDINGDNVVNNRDLTRLFQYLSGWDVVVNTDVLDVDGDGKVNNKDLTRLFQYLSGWNVEIPLKNISDISGFLWPVPGYYGISSPFGVRYGKNHNGIDISGGGINGKPIVAIADGVVTMANNSWTVEQGTSGNLSYGNYCAINHGTITINGSSAQYVAFYAHATAIVVSAGQTVSKGQVIGYVGTTGNATGPHLHLGIQKNGAWVNPLPLFNK